MPKPTRHPIQTIELNEYPAYLEHEFKEGDRVSLRREHRTAVLKDLIRKHRKMYVYAEIDGGVGGKRFAERTKKEIRREYHLITDNEGVVIGRSPVFGLPTYNISNVCYLVGGIGFGGLDYEYDVCFVMVDYDKTRDIHNKVCMVWTLWTGAIEKVNG